MIHVYTANTPNGIKIPIALEELGVEYQVIYLDLANKDQKTKQFLAINPNGRIPAIIDHSNLDSQGNPRTVFESGAILLYLAEKFHGLLGDSEWERTNALEWLFFQMGGIGPMFGQVSFFKSTDVYPAKNAVARFEDESYRLVTVLESQLQNNEWLAGASYSIADIANYGWLRYAESVGIDLDDFPAVKEWRATIESRLATRKGLQRVEQPDTYYSSDGRRLAG